MDLYSYYHLNWTEKTVFVGHRHPEYELKFITSGELEVTCDNVVLTMYPGDMMLYQPDVFHMERSVTNRAEFSVIHFKTDTPLLDKPKFLSLSGDNLTLINLLISTTEKLCTSGMPFCGPERRFAGNKLLAAFLYNIHNLSMPYHLKGGKHVEIYTRATDYMQEHLDGNLSIPQIAKHCGVCATTLKEVFTEFTGHGVAKYYLDLRIETAKQLLSQDFPLGEVSERLGFSSSSYFSQCFTRECGVNPSHFKKQFRQGE